MVLRCIGVWAAIPGIERWNTGIKESFVEGAAFDLGLEEHRVLTVDGVFMVGPPCQNNMNTEYILTIQYIFRKQK